MEAVGHSAACRERIEDMMKANKDFRERLYRADERINKMPEYLEKKDREANEETQSAKRPRTEASGTATGSRDPLPQQETERDAEMGVPEAGVHGEIAGSSKRSLEEPETEGRHGRRQRLAHLDTGHRGQVIGELHWRGGVLQGSSVAVELCQYSIDEEGLDAVSRKKWDFSKEEEREPSFWQTLTGEDLPCCGKSGTVLTNWNRMQAELEKEDVDVGDVRDLLTKLTETMRKKRSELQLHRDDGLELHECFSLGTNEPERLWTWKRL